MNAPLSSAHWYRVADLRPRLAVDAALARHLTRGRVWHVLTHAGSARQVRLNEAAWAFAGRCDGSRSVDAIWHELLDTQGEAAPTQDEVLRVLTRMHAAGLMRFDSAPDLDILFEVRADASRRRTRSRVNPLAMRLRLFDPTRLIGQVWPVARALTGLPALLLWVVLVLGAALSIAPHAGELAAALGKAQAVPHTLALLWFVIPLTKAIHEGAHALAVRKFGGQVRDAGITLLLLTPAPWIDASAASAFPSRRARLAVSAAGIAADLAMAACAAFVWLAVAPGLVRDAALVTFAVCGLGALAINANPLMRFDGYHVLTDLADLPNLALRSQAWWAELARRVFHGADAPDPVALPRGEAKWLALYAPASLLWRVGLLAGFALWAGQWSWLIGSLLGAAFAVWLLLRPLAALRDLWRNAPSRAARSRAAFAGAVSCAALAGAVFVLPLPASVVATGVVWPRDEAQVRAGAGGFVASLQARHGSVVAPDTTLVSLADDSVIAERDRAAAALAGHQARQYNALLRDPAEAGAAALDIERGMAELARAEDKVAQLDVTSRTAGRLVLPHEADLPGSHAKRGAMLGYILSPGPAHVRAALDEDDALRVRGGVRAIHVRLPGAASPTLVAHLALDMPAATQELPSAALGTRGGGPFAIDPADREGRRTLDPVFLVDLAVPALEQERMGGRAWVRFDLGSETLGAWASRRVRQLLLRHFNPAGQA